MDFKTRLVAVKPRDLSGSNSSDRFAYQQAWALCHVLELHLSGQDYVVIFDHHEDVAVLDSEANPTVMSGFQVKTKASGNFTIPALLKQEQGQGQPPAPLPSILGKLYDLKAKFPQEVKGLSVVSNTSVSVRLASDGKRCLDRTKTEFTELHAVDRQLILDGLKNELSLQDPPEVDGVLRFEKAELPLSAHDTHARGKLVEFLQHLFPDQSFQVFPLYRTLLSEVSVRNNNTEDNETYDQLLQHKALTRNRFSEILKQAGVSASRVEAGEVIERLNAEQCPFPSISMVKHEWDTVRLDRYSRKDIPYLRLREAVLKALEDHKSENRLWGLINNCYIHVFPRLRKEWGFSEGYIKTLIALEAYEYKQSPNSSPSSQEEG